MQGFRIQRVAIEGFKGFTRRQTINLQGRHAFCVGRNGNGKSSLLEAIRWGLFGSTRRPNEVVAHRQYAGDCCVEITLTRDGLPWTLKRRLIRGRSGGSDAVLTDDQGVEHKMREIMPQLDSQEAGEGMHIIFASQSTPLRKQPEDLSPFEKTVFGHLGLTNPRALLSEMQSFIESQDSIEHSLADEITRVRNENNRKIMSIEEERGRILAAPPWDTDMPPTLSESEDHARVLVRDIAGLQAQPDLDDLSLEALVQRVTEALAAERHRDPEGLRAELSGTDTLLSQLRKLSEAYDQIETIVAKFEEARSALQSRLSGVTLDELRAEVEDVSGRASRTELQANVLETSISLFEQFNDAQLPCPVCETVFGRDELDNAIRHRAGELERDSATASLATLKEQLREAEEINALVHSSEHQLRQLTDKAKQMTREIHPTVVKDLAQLSEANERGKIVARLETRKKSINRRVNDLAGALSEVEARSSRLRDEHRFHDLQARLDQLHRLKDRLDDVQKEYERLVSFGESVRNIRDAADAQLVDLLRHEIPLLSENLSRVYSALSNHPWYDQLRIDLTKLPKLELRVASSQDNTERLELTAVLNGQAEAAVNLVPYFVFGQGDRTPTEVYAVLLDDPTRAFDEEHIKILGKRLKELGEHVQLVVASQETARFRELIADDFPASSYVVVECKEWSFHDGPTLNVECCG